MVFLVFQRGTFEMGEPFSVEHRVAKQKRECLVVLICLCPPRYKVKVHSESEIQLFTAFADGALHCIRVCSRLYCVRTAAIVLYFPTFPGEMPRSAQYTQYKKPCQTLAETITQATRATRI